MTLQEALKKAIIAYFDNEDELEINKTKEGGAKYNKKYFDEFAKRMNGTDVEDEDE